jgi:hypothetical protein
MLWGLSMSLIPFHRKNCHGSVAYRAPIVCLATLILLARGLPVGLLYGAQNQAIHSFANHNHWPCFDQSRYSVVEFASCLAKRSTPGCRLSSDPRGPRVRRDRRRQLAVRPSSSSKLTILRTFLAAT